MAVRCYLTFTRQFESHALLTPLSSSTDPLPVACRTLQTQLQKHFPFPSTVLGVGCGDLPPCSYLNSFTGYTRMKGLTFYYRHPKYPDSTTTSINRRKIKITFGYRLVNGMQNLRFFRTISIKLKIFERITLSLMLFLVAKYF